MATVWIPALLRHLTKGREQVDVEGSTVRQLIEALEESYPGIKQNLCEGEHLAPSIGVSVDGRIDPLGLLSPVRERSEIHFLPKVAGG
jgi:molybdopterin synthase sulfur carrier subunit